MIETQHSLEWRVVGASVRGASHERSGLPNQDAIKWVPPSGGGASVAVAVSDGHGSAKSFRSARGSQIAVATATGEVQDLLAAHSALGLSAIKREIEERLPQRLVRNWAAGVNADLEGEPFSEAELEQLAQKDGPSAQRSVEKNPLLAYGATLLTAVVAPTFMAFVQLGDGDILVVTDTGRVSRPLATDARLFANETTSLCMVDAWKDFRVGFQVVDEGKAPALVLLSTDGYANSFRDDESFLKVGSDILEMIRADGLDKVAQDLANWLGEASRVGSGDDITLGVAHRTITLAAAGQEPARLAEAHEDEPVNS
jgi:serine/threonine protein phosphatase PrpC